jgi:predicted nuclease of predicted toxin-antitoxin system
MTFWLDAQLDPTLTVWLSSGFGVTAKSLKELDLLDRSDEELFAAGGRFPNVVIFSKDSDFADLVTERGKPPQILWLRAPNQRTLKLQALLAKSFPEALRLLEAGEPLVEISEDGN